MEGVGRNILSYMGKEKLLFACAVSVCVLDVISGVFVPLLIGFALDNVVDSLESGIRDDRQLLVYAVLILASGLVRFVAHGLSLCLGEMFCGTVTMVLRADVFEALQEHSHRYYDEHSTGDLVSKSTTDIIALWELFWSFPRHGTYAIVQLVAILTILAIMDYVLALVCLISLPTMWLFTRRFQVAYSPVFFESRTQFGKLNKVLQENIDGAAVTKAFNGKEKEMAKFDEKNQAYRDLMFRALKLRGALWPQMHMIAGVFSAVVLVVGGYRTIHGDLSPGSLLTALLFATMLSRPMRNLADLAIWWARGMSAGERVFGILHSVPDIRDKPDALELPADATGDVIFENVSFGYRDEPVLTDVTLHIENGSTVAVLGATGCGKTSLINLLPRSYDVSAGSVQIDGIDIRDLRRESLRSRIGFVDQETFLFSRTVHDNIAFGRPKATREEVVAVATVAQAHEFIAEFKDGFDTVVGERGVTLSGGQRQRIAIARALLADPLIVVMDDSLSAVDTKTERQIQNATDALLKNRTTFIVTQRLSTTSSADLIVVMKDGRIAEKGTHDELIAYNGQYKILQDTQQHGLIDFDSINQESAQSE